MEKSSRRKQKKVQKMDHRDHWDKKAWDVDINQDKGSYTLLPTWDIIPQEWHGCSRG